MEDYICSEPINMLILKISVNDTDDLIQLNLFNLN